MAKIKRYIVDIQLENTNTDTLKFLYSHLGMFLVFFRDVSLSKTLSSYGTLNLKITVKTPMDQDFVEYRLSPYHAQVKNVLGNNLTRFEVRNF